MRIFDQPNLIDGKWKCPICKSNEVKPVVLVGIDGTQEGNNIEARQYHLDCIELTEYQPKLGDIVLAMRFQGEKD